MKNKNGFALLLGGIILLSPIFSSAQSEHIPAARKMEMLHETMGDKYLPNAYQNKKTSPGYKCQKTGISKPNGSSIVTVQVNVDGSGQNILGDAANEPNIAVDPLDENKMVIGWRQFDNVNSNFRQAGWSYTSDGGQTWKFPGVIQPGVFRSDPVLDYDLTGNFYFNSLQNDFTAQVFKSADGGADWDNGTKANGGDKQWMAIDHTAGAGRGNIYSFWTYAYSTCLPGFFTRSTNEDTSYENCTIVDGYPFWGTMAVGNNGELYIAGADTLSDSIVVVKSLNAQMQDSPVRWNHPVTVFMDGFLNASLSVNPIGLLGQTNIDVDRSNGPGSGNVYIMASMTRESNFDPGDVMFAKSTDGGLSWSSPMRINDDNSATNSQWLAAMSVAPNGRIDAAWLDTRDAPPGSDSSALYYSFSTDGGDTWSANERLSASFDPHVGYPHQNKMGDYLDMVSDNSGARLAWANTFNGEEDVYYSRIIPEVATGVNEISATSAFSVYPNPARGEFVITGSEMAGIEIFNTMGEKVYSKTDFQTTDKIDISSQPAGIYFLKISSRDGCSVIKKIIKE